MDIRGFLVAAALFAGSAAEAAGVRDFRPPLDKSDYRGYVAVWVNPWFPLNKPARHALGGPNMPYVSGCDWQKGMDLCAEYGINAFVPEINESGAWTSVWHELLAEAPKCRADVRVGMYFGFYSASPEAAVASVKKILGPFRKDLDEHPCVLRAGGYPVMVVVCVLCAFAASLFRTPLVEVFARRMGERLDGRGVAYCRNVTRAWVAFLTAHLAVTVATVFMSYEAWALYNGCIAYVLMGLMFAGEWIVRRRVRRA